MARATSGGRTTTRKRKVAIDSSGKVFIQATFNNVIISVTNQNGDVIAWSSSGKKGFKGSKKNTPYAGQVSANDVVKTAYDLGMRRAEVFVKGPGSARESAIRTIHNGGIEIISIEDLTPIPHNGCRPPKRRRV
jgi:small subunit ribosomal protein S11